MRFSTMTGLFFEMSAKYLANMRSCFDRYTLHLTMPNSLASTIQRQYGKVTPGKSYLCRWNAIKHAQTSPQHRVLFALPL